VTGRTRVPRITPWARVVAVSAVLVVGALAALLAGDLATQHERRVSYAVRGSLNGLVFDVGAGDIEIAGGGRHPAAAVQVTERYAYGHDAVTRRRVEGGVVTIRSRCPSSVLAACSVRYRVVVPDNVPVDVRTGDGAVRLRGYRGSARLSSGSGDIDVGGFCGFSLQARAESGHVAADAACAPQRLSLRSTTGWVHAVVPGGRYAIDAESASGRRTVRGVT
jgi:hypothetical protein